MTLYIKYRPQQIKDLDLVSVREKLLKWVKSGDLPHALLFTGPRGTGKTSAARIIAKVYNCEKNKKPAEPCNRCGQCLSITKGSNVDVVELDAASHRGIEDVRAIKEAVKLVPVSARYKVYIIDEAHMLTTEASNALLKTLEEPPTRTVFILATTNEEKLIDTIKSRTTIIEFNKATEKEVTASLKKKVRGEKIKFEDKALALIAHGVDGSFRDAVKFLEELIQSGVPLKEKEVGTYLEKMGIFSVDDLLRLMVEKNVKKGVAHVQKLVEKNVRFDGLIDRLIERIRLNILSQMSVVEGGEIDLSTEESIRLVDLLMTARKNVNLVTVPSLPLEIAIIQWCGGDKDVNGDVVEDRQLNSSEKGDLSPKKLADKKSTPLITAFKNTPPFQGRDELNADRPASLEETSGSDSGEDVIDTKRPKKEVKNQRHFSGVVDGGLSKNNWEKILKNIRPINVSIEALLRAAKPVNFDGHCLTLGVYYRFHKERLEEDKNRVLLERIVEKVLSSPVKVQCRLTEPPDVRTKKPKNPVVLEETKDEDVVRIAKEVFSS